MKLFINDAPVSFTLENEQTAYTVVAALLEWLNERQLTLLELQLNGKPYLAPPVPESLKALRVEGIAELRCTTATTSAYSTFVLLSVAEALQGLETALTAEQLHKQTAAISEKLAWMRSALSGIAKVLKLNENLNAPINSLKILEQTLYQIKRGEVAYNAANISTQLKGILTQLSHQELVLTTRAFAHELKFYQQAAANPDEPPATLSAFLHELKRAASTLIDTLKHWLVKIATAFQQSDTGMALIWLGELTQALSLLLSLHHITADTATPTPASTNLNAILKQLLNAMQANDYVELCDLLEYELSAALETFASASGMVDAANTNPDAQQ